MNVINLSKLQCKTLWGEIMIKEKVYKSIRKMQIDEDVDAIFSKTIIKRMLKSKINVNGRKKTVQNKTMGEIIDSIIDGSFFNNVSLSKRLRQDILDYLKDVGVIEYLENTCEQYNQTMKTLAEQKAAKIEQNKLKRRKEFKEIRTSQNNF